MLVQLEKNVNLWILLNFSFVESQRGGSKFAVVRSKTGKVIKEKLNVSLKVPLK